MRTIARISGLLLASAPRPRPCVAMAGAQRLVVVISAGARPAGTLHSVADINSTVVHDDPGRAKHKVCMDAFDRAIAAGPVVAPPSQCSLWTARTK